MYFKALFLAAAFVFSFQARAQDISPEVSADHHVLFRLRAPHAEKVSVQISGTKEPLALQKDGHGVWSVTTAPLQPDYYGYTFSIDGIDVADPSNPNTVPNLFYFGSMLHVPGPKSLAWEVNDVPHGIIHHHFFHSKIISDDRDFYVYTPPNYDVKMAYPVLYLLHGYSDTAEAWSAVGRVNVILDNLIVQKKSKPMIVVMPLGYGSLEMVSRGISAFHDENLRKLNETRFRNSLTEEVIPLVEKTYSTSRDRAIAGLSMGGAEALFVGLNDSKAFGWVGAFSAGGLSDEVKNDFSSLDVKDHPLNLLWLSCGKEDDLFSKNEKLRDWLKSQGFLVKWSETEGAHTWMVWRRNFVEFASLLFRDKK
jgi:enterochelin esterase-like enzyme